MKKLLKNQPQYLMLLFEIHFNDNTCLFVNMFIFH